MTRTPRITEQRTRRNKTGRLHPEQIAEQGAGAVSSSVEQTSNSALIPVPCSRPSPEKKEKKKLGSQEDASTSDPERYHPLCDNGRPGILSVYAPLGSRPRKESGRCYD